MDNKELSQWIAAQRQTSSGSLDRSPAPGQLHLHQHHHPAASPLVEPRRELPHPLVTAMAMLVFSVALSLPIALLAALVEASNRPSIQYIHPGR